MLEDLVPVKNPLPDFQTETFYYLLTWQRYREREREREGRWEGEKRGKDIDGEKETEREDPRVSLPLLTRTLIPSWGLDPYDIIYI